MQVIHSSNLIADAIKQSTCSFSIMLGWSSHQKIIVTVEFSKLTQAELQPSTTVGFLGG